MDIKAMPLYKHYREKRFKAVAFSVLYAYAFFPLVIIMAIILLLRIVAETIAECMESAEQGVEKLFPFRNTLEYFWNAENNALYALRIQIRAEKQKKA